MLVFDVRVTSGPVTTLTVPDNAAPVIGLQYVTPDCDRTELPAGGLLVGQLTKVSGVQVHAHFRTIFHIFRVNLNAELVSWRAWRKRTTMPVKEESEGDVFVEFITHYLFLCIIDCLLKPQFLFGRLTHYPAFQTEMEACLSEPRPRSFS